MSSTKAIGRVGDWMPRREAHFYNRTGAALVVGGAYMVDMIGSATESTDLTPGGENSVFANIVAVTQAQLAQGVPIVVALEAAADNEPARCLLEGFTEVQVLDDDTSTTDVDAGDGISILVSESAVAFQATAGTDRVLGYALEAAAASGSTNDYSLKKVLFWGGRYVTGEPGT